MQKDGSLSSALLDSYAEKLIKSLMDIRPKVFMCDK